MTTTIPKKSLSGLGLREGDTLHVLAAQEADYLVRVEHAGEKAPTTSRADAVSEWLRTSTGIVRLAPGETEDDVRMAYYRQKYKINA